MTKSRLGKKYKSHLFLILVQFSNVIKTNPKSSNIFSNIITPDIIYNQSNFFNNTTSNSTVQYRRFMQRASHLFIMLFLLVVLCTKPCIHPGTISYQLQTHVLTQVQAQAQAETQTQTQAHVEAYAHVQT